MLHVPAGRQAPLSAQTISETYSDRRKIVSQDAFTPCGPVVTACTSHRRDVFMSMGGLDPYLKAAEDGDPGIWVKLSGAGFIYAPEAAVFHQHRTSVKTLIQQQEAHAKGVMRLHKKYSPYFSPADVVLPPALKALSTALTYPLILFTSYNVPDRDYRLTEPLLGLSSCCAIIYSTIRECIAGEKYAGKKYDRRISFLPVQSVSGKLKKKAEKRGVEKCISF